MTNEGRTRWFAKMMESGLDNQIFAPSDVLDHATPEVARYHGAAEPRDGGGRRFVRCPAATRAPCCALQAIPCR